MQSTDNKKDTTIVSFKESLLFDWDTLYIFDSMLYPDEISNALGFNFECDIVAEGKRLLIYLKDKQVVQEKLSSCLNITFVNMKKDGVVKIGRYTYFELVKKEINNRQHYFIYEL